jgi:parallel beta-helix repeat protein
MQIGQCGSVTETSELVKDINSEYTCLSIEGDNVILDCRGHSITGVKREDAYAIYVTGKNDTIENCITENFGSGILIDSSSDLYIHDVVVSGNLQYGILVKSSKNISLERVTASGNDQAGIGLLSSSEISLSDNKISGAAVGILAESSDVTKLSSNNICDYVSTAMRCNDTRIFSSEDNMCKISVGCNITCLPCEQPSNQ